MSDVTSKIREGATFQQGFRSLAEAEVTAVETAALDDVEWVRIVIINTSAHPWGETLAYIIVSNQT